MFVTQYFANRQSTRKKAQLHLQGMLPLPYYELSSLSVRVGFGIEPDGRLVPDTEIASV